CCEEGVLWECMARIDGECAWGAASEIGRSRCGGGGPACRDRDDRQREVTFRDARLIALCAEVVLLRRRTRGQDRIARSAELQARVLQLHSQGTARSGCGDHAVEFVASVGCLETGFCAGCRQHRGPETVGTLLRFGSGIW